MLEHFAKRGAVSDDFAGAALGGDFFAEEADFFFEPLFEKGDFLEGVCVCDAHGSVVGEDAQPFEIRGVERPFDLDPAGTFRATFHDAGHILGSVGVTIEADIIKQKLPENNGGYLAIQQTESSYGKIDKRMYTDLASDHPIDLTRYQVANCYMGRIGLINSGGPSGNNDFAEAVKTAVINKRAGGQGLISGRKAFQRPIEEGAKLLHTIQDVYLTKEVTIA